jgi:hypothetical protein
LLKRLGQHAEVGPRLSFGRVQGDPSEAAISHSCRTFVRLHSFRARLESLRGTQEKPGAVTLGEVADRNEPYQCGVLSLRPSWPVSTRAWSNDSTLTVQGRTTVTSSPTTRGEKIASTKRTRCSHRRCRRPLVRMRRRGDARLVRPCFCRHSDVHLDSPRCTPRVAPSDSPRCSRLLFNGVTTCTPAQHCRETTPDSSCEKQRVIALNALKTSS